MRTTAFKAPGTRQTTTKKKKITQQAAVARQGQGPIEKSKLSSQLPHSQAGRPLAPPHTYIPSTVFNVQIYPIYSHHRDIESPHLISHTRHVHTRHNGPRQSQNREYVRRARGEGTETDKGHARARARGNTTGRLHWCTGAIPRVATTQKPETSTVVSNGHGRSRNHHHGMNNTERNPRQPAGSHSKRSTTKEPYTPHVQCRCESSSIVACTGWLEVCGSAAPPARATRRDCGELLARVRRGRALGRPTSHRSVARTPCPSSRSPRRRPGSASPHHPAAARPPPNRGLGSASAAGPQQLGLRWASAAGPLLGLSSWAFAGSPPPTARAQTF